MKPLVIYHANCADGFGAAFAAWLKLGDEAEYVAMQYGPLAADCPQVEDRDVYILDFSFPRPDMEHIFRHAARVVWLDHHKTAFEMWGLATNVPGCPAYTEHEQWGGRHTVRLDNNKSGAYLAWEHFHPGTKVPMLIRHIDDYDRWQFTLDGTKAFNKALWSYAPWSFEQWERFMRLSDAPDWRVPFIREGDAILRAHDQNVQSVVKAAARRYVIDTRPINGLLWPGLAANCPPHLTSDVGHELAVQSGTFGLCWSQDKNGIIQCGLRSIGDYDVSEIAKCFGGGGHRNAAGFRTDMETLQSWIRI